MCFRCSTEKRFDLGLYESGTTRFVQFDKPGISFIFCNIHAQMSAVVIALNNSVLCDIRRARRHQHEQRCTRALPDARLPPVSLSGCIARRGTRNHVTPGDTFLGSFSLAESDLELAHKNKYGREYDRPDPDSPAYARP